MENLIIRKAATGDINTLLEFEQAIVAAERPFDVTLKEGEIHYYDLAKLVSAADTEVLVAAAGDEIIGSGYCSIREAKDYLKHERYGYIGFIYVVPEYRGKSVSRRILEALEQWAVTQGVTEIRLEVYKDNSPAVRAYEKSGFKPHILEMRKPAARRNSE